MKLKPSSPYHQSSNAYAIFSSRLNKVGERWLPSVSNNDASVKQNDNDEHKPIPLAALAASSKVLHALTTASAPKCGETTLKSTVLTSAVFFYKTPLRVTTGIAKMGVNIFYAALSTIATLTQKVPSPTQHIETHSLYGRGRLPENPCVGSSILPWATKVLRPTVLGWAFCFWGTPVCAGLPPVLRVLTSPCNLGI